MELVLAIAAFGGGAWLLVEAVETLVGALRGWATAAGLSGVVLAALVLGLDLESTAAGVAATLDDLPGTALGTSIGAAILLLTLGLGLAGLVAPFRVRRRRDARRRRHRRGRAERARPRRRADPCGGRGPRGALPAARLARRPRAQGGGAAGGRPSDAPATASSPASSSRSPGWSSAPSCSSGAPGASSTSSSSPRPSSAC
jgi:hypothetical protein